MLARETLDTPSAVVMEEAFKYVDVEFNSAVPLLKMVASLSSFMLTADILRLSRQSHLPEVSQLL